MEPSCNQPVASTNKPWVTRFFPLWKFKASQPAMTPCTQVAHLEKESINKEECNNSEDPDGIKGITKEFIVYLARAVKDGQQEKKHCYHCSSPDHFMCNCPLVVASRILTFKPKRGDGTKEGSLGPSNKGNPTKGALGCDTQDIKCQTQTPFLNPNPFNQWYGIENIARVRVNRQRCMALLDNSTQINTIMPGFI